MVRAADYYFSDCGDGGSGTESDPWCIKNPNSGGKKTTFAFLLNNSLPGPKAGPGDTIYLCAGACDGLGSATYNLEASVIDRYGKEIGFAVTIEGTSGSPITIRTLSGETVSLSGDTNGDNVYQSGELMRMVSNEDIGTLGADAMGKKFIHWIGIIFERTENHMFNLDQDPHGWLFDRVELRYAHPLMWSGGPDGFHTRGCPTDAGSHGFKVSNLTGPFTVRNSVVHHLCGFAHRGLDNFAPGAAMLFEGNEYYNTDCVTNDHNRSGSPISQATVRIADNYIHDTRCGIGIEERMRNVTIEDNTLACLGEYVVNSGGRCSFAIGISDGEGDIGTGATTTNSIVVRRNKIYGVSGSDSTPGWYLGGLHFTATNTNGSEGLDAVIENNMFWRIRSDFSSRVKTREALLVDTSKPVTIQNNTIYYSRFPLAVDGANHVIRNNLIVREDSGSSPAEMWVYSGAAGSVFENNNIWDFGTASPEVVHVDGGDSYTCADINAGQFGATNKCSPTTFDTCGDATYCRTIDSDFTKWDLHLVAGDTANRDAGAVTGPSDDIDRESRIGAVDIGADELQIGPPTAMVELSMSGEPAPEFNQVYLLKTGAWTLTLVTSSEVVSVPTPVTFTDSQGRQVDIPLNGTVPGASFVGSFTVDATTAEGEGAFSLPTDALSDGQGNTGNQIVSGGDASIDQTVPQAPTNVAAQ